MKYVWKGPPTAIEVWGDGPEPIFSGSVRTDGDIPADLPETHTQVQSWLAFNLIAPATPAPAPLKLKEQPNG